MVVATIQNVRSLSDPLKPFLYSMQFSSVKGEQGASTSDLTLRVQSTTKPGRTIEQLPVDYPGGHTIRYGGGTTYDGTWTTEITEGANAEVKRRIVEWMNFVHNPETSIGSFKQLYESTVILEQYNNANEVVETTKMLGIFPTNVAETSLSNADKASPIIISVTWSYDYWVYV